MTTSFDRVHLNAALTAVLPAIDARVMMPVLACVRIVTHDGAATVVATDLELTIVRSLQVGGDDLDVVVSAKRLAAIVGRMRGETVELAVVDQQVTITSGSATATLPAVTPSEFPRVADGVQGDEVKLGADELALLAKVVPFASGDESRLPLTGVLFDGTEIVATTSYHLAWAELGVQLPRMLVPAKLLKAVLAQVDHEQGLVIRFDGDRAEVTDGTTTWATRLIQEEAPQVRNLLDRYRQPDTEVTCSVKALRQAMALADLVRADGEAMLLGVTKGAVKVWSRQADVGEVADVAEAVVEGPDVECWGFNPKYMRDVLNALTGETITIGLFEEPARKPVLIEDGDWLALVMPVVPSASAS